MTDIRHRSEEVREVRQVLEELKEVRQWLEEVMDVRQRSEEVREVRQGSGGEGGKAGVGRCAVGKAGVRGGDGY